MWEITTSIQNPTLIPSEQNTKCRKYEVWDMRLLSDLQQWMIDISQVCRDIKVSDPYQELTKPDKMRRPVGGSSHISLIRLHPTNKRHPWDVIQWCTSIVWGPYIGYVSSSPHWTLWYISFELPWHDQFVNTLIFLYHGVQYINWALLALSVDKDYASTSQFQE